jgi:hypothetical protein
MSDELERLRWALACILDETEGELDAATHLECAGQIAREALEESAHLARPGKDLTHDTRGLEAWRGSTS